MIYALTGVRLILILGHIPINLTLDSYLPNPNANPILGTLSLGLLNFNNEPNKMNVEIDVDTELSIKCAVKGNPSPDYPLLTFDDNYGSTGLDLDTSSTLTCTDK